MCSFTQFDFVRHCTEENTTTPLGPAVQLILTPDPNPILIQYWLFGQCSLSDHETERMFMISRSTESVETRVFPRLSSSPIVLPRIEVDPFLVVVVIVHYHYMRHSSSKYKTDEYELQNELPMMPGEDGLML